jgi:hypothetical protein
MRRLALVFALLLLASSAVFGATGSNEILLAPDGSVFSVEIVTGDQLPEGSEATTALRLRVARADDDVTSHFVPASLKGGRNSNPALAYDNKTDTLFIFWVRAPHITTSELLICSFRNGAFSEPTVLDGGLFRYREHLQIAVTRFALDEFANASAEAVAIHAIWWDTNGWDERARYAMLQMVDAVDFLGSRNSEPEPVPDTFNPRVLTFPTVAAGATLDRADVTFGDKETNRIHRVDLIPVIANGVLKPPIGVRRGEVPAPVLTSSGSDSTVATITDPIDAQSLLLYTVDGAKVRYLVYENGSWTGTKSITLDSHVTEAAAVEALKRRLADR